MQKIDRDLLELAVTHLEDELKALDNPAALIEAIHDAAADPGDRFKAITERASRTTNRMLREHGFKENYPGEQFTSAHRLTMLIGVHIGLHYAKLGKKAKA